MSTAVICIGSKGSEDAQSFKDKLSLGTWLFDWNNSDGEMFQPIPLLTSYMNGTKVQCPTPKSCLEKIPPDTKLLILDLGLGGNFGTSHLEGFINAARERGLINMVVATFPFMFEAKSRKLAIPGYRHALLTSDLFYCFPTDDLVGKLGMKTKLEDGWAYQRQRQIDVIRSLVLMEQHGYIEDLIRFKPPLTTLHHASIEAPTLDKAVSRLGDLIDDLILPEKWLHRTNQFTVVIHAAHKPKESTLESIEAKLRKKVLSVGYVQTFFCKDESQDTRCKLSLIALSKIAEPWNRFSIEGIGTPVTTEWLFR